jgi:divalent metal cation (Fe/Co/Zn/Cd) transporter
MLIGMGAVVGLGLMEHAHAHVHDHGTHGHHDHGAPASLGWVLTAFALVSIALHAFIVWFLYSGRAHLTVLGACLSMGTHVLLMVVMACCGLLMATFHLPGLDTLMAFVIACVMVMTGARLGLRSTKVLLGATS